ncbi:hypothetical protein ACLMJK_004119 [Lecanora helva]
MATSTSSGTTDKMANKANIPYEQRGRMTWDPAYRAKYQDEFASSSESDDDDSDEYYDYPIGAYVSGDQPKTQPPALSLPPHARPPTTAFRNRNPTVGGKNKITSPDGFQRVERIDPRKRRRMNFGVNRDNAAKAAFRRRESATGRFILPRDCNEIEPSLVKMYDFFEELGVRLGSFIRPPQQIKERVIDIWGDEVQIARTKTELEHWVNPSQRQITTARGKEHFANVYSTAGDKYKKIVEKVKREADIRKFQQEPDANTVFPYIGSFLWPTDEIVPTDLLGPSLEALDPLRIQRRCYITFDARLSAFKIMTKKLESVKEVLARLQGIMKEYVVRINRPIVRYYIDPPSAMDCREQMRKMAVRSVVANNTSPVIPLMTGKGLEPKAQNRWVLQKRVLRAQSDRGTEDALRKTIPNLRFYRGRVRLRVHFGTFALTSFRWPTATSAVSFEDFMKNLAIPGTKGVMVRDFLQFRGDSKFIMGKIHEASDLFQPIDNQIMSLADVSPSFCAYFQCKEGDNARVTFEVEMHPNILDTNLHERTYAQWTKCGRAENADPLEIYMVDLLGGPSWKLQASTETTIDQTRITPRMVQFADSVKMKKNRASKIEHTGEPVFEWDKTGQSMLVLAFQQKTSLRFRLIRNMEYIIEISRYDTYDVPTPANSYRTTFNDARKAPGKQPVIKEGASQTTDWAASLWNDEWDTELLANTRLGIGQSADWDPRLTTFFPTPSGAATSAKKGDISEGVREFLQIVGEVNKLLGDIKKGRTDPGKTS